VSIVPLFNPSDETVLAPIKAKMKIPMRDFAVPLLHTNIRSIPPNLGEKFPLIPG
jgi:hypothetical protein